jgi:glycosyltransferase involved in cell wall biosynthesis
MRSKVKWTRNDTQVNTAANSMRVLRIIARMNIGGPAIQISGIARELNSEHFDHLVVTGFCEKNEIDLVEFSNIDLKMRRIEGFGREIGLLSDFSAFLELRRIMKVFKPHIVHTHTAKAGVLGRLASISLNAGHKRVHTFHGHLLNGYFSNFMTRIVILIERFLAKYTEILISVGRDVAEDLIKAGIGVRSQYRIVPPGVEIDLLPEKYSARKSLGLIEDAIYVLWIGRVESIKAPHRILDIARITSRNNSEIRFCVAGDGNLLPEISQLARVEKLPIDFLGWQPAIEEALAAADMVLLTSYNEGTPLSLIQAQLAGLPVVASNVGSVSEIMKNTESGFVINYNTQKFADLVINLSTNEKLREKMGKVGKEFATDKFSIARLTKNHETIYLSLFN